MFLKNIMSKFKNKKNKNAFTLIEMLIVVGIIGLLLAMIIPNFTKLREQAKNRANIANGQKLLDMLESYYLSTGTYPQASGTAYIADLLSTLTGYVATDTTNLNGTAKDFVNPFTGASYTGTANNSGNISVGFAANEQGLILQIYGQTTSVIKKIDSSQ